MRLHRFTDVSGKNNGKYRIEEWRINGKRIRN
jgi:hypothetical protein